MEGPPGVTVGLHRGSLSMGIGCVVCGYRVGGWAARGKGFGLGVQTG